MSVENLHPTENHLHLTVADSTLYQYDYDVPTTRFDFLVRVFHRILSDSSSNPDSIITYNNFESISQPMHKFLESVPEREAAMARMLSGVAVPFAVDGGNEGRNFLHWVELSPCHAYALQHDTLRGFDSVMRRISGVAARIAATAVGLGRKQAEMLIIIDMHSVVPPDEFERVVSSSRVYNIDNDSNNNETDEYESDNDGDDHDGDDQADDDEDDEDDEDDDNDYDDDSELDLATEQSLLELGVRSRAADALVVEMLQKLNFEERSDHDQDQDDDTCVICMEEVMFGSQLIRMPCSHLFHGDCIKQWLQRSNACPLCRFSLPHVDD